ncbi:Demethylrebeccamycin-D-glucose O-methyltransferase [Defluviimonas aquaemixtae]|uniref:Demethylrebeccamycin-D-glucose O-methyltransferase n=1 Tax=Albidovulum aquaemixtae TaxID=1542388 RepID=A0A2R8BMN5_9RHOB|nr:class I SAM-dependent methyltransferase [Defluviimonas aquaemixtae]SPH24692.1 Demethylrebeccamycin-D-glucose O-methyltransferase [Defluviimonas aquaemixtae]
MTTMTTPTVDLAAVKEKQRAAWGAGDYAVIGTTLQIVGEELCEAIDLRAGTKVLDVAAGNGNATLAAARRFCEVTSTDYVQALLDRSRRRAEAERLDVTYQIADAEALPFADGSFDTVLSTFGVMFTPDQAMAASELARVCRTGGTIGMANWTADGFIGQVFKTLGKHIAPAPGVQSPARWGDEGVLRELFSDKVSDIQIVEKEFVFRYRSAAHFLDVFRTYYGPLNRAFLALGEKGDALRSDLEALIARFNVAGRDGFVVPSTYAEVRIRK